MKGQPENCLILSDLHEKFDASSIDQPQPPTPPSHKTIVVSIQAPQDPPKPTNEELRASNDLKERWVLLAVVLSIAFLLVCVGVYFLLSNHYENEVVSRLVAQPFTENNDFVYFHLPNKMRVLFVRPNTQMNETYICSLISHVRRRRVRDRPP